MYGLKMVHVPYKGNVAALLALMTGEVDFGTYAVPPAVPVIKGRKIRALAVLTDQRINVLPEVPTAKEGGVDLSLTGWYGIFAPAGTPRALVDRLASELHKVVGSSDVQERFAAVGFEPMTNTPEEFGEFLKSEIARFAKIVKTAGIKAD
jgi:tripartite-type tricarboxylate transporter receptor subunit TctC